MPHLYPTGQGFIHEYPTAEIDVDDETAEMLLAYHPPIFSLEPTGWPPEPQETEGTGSEMTGIEAPADGSLAELVLKPGLLAIDSTAGGFVGEEGSQLVMVGENGPELVIPPGTQPTAETAGPADAGPADSSAKE
jgi:hypothetical protein